MKTIHISHQDLVKNQSKAEEISSDSTKKLNCNEYNLKKSFTLSLLYQKTKPFYQKTKPYL